ncbi:MAG TPA: asparagine synthase (glutamine-hydrolyzing) [Dongiaceae bacterium]|nr:asparagine synthase (glutamine-hydrolyzing) [Dongiaceae bacterium]
MCGICAIYNFDESEPVRMDVLNAMNREITHRGPDDCGSYVRGHVGLAMRRLSIVDLRSGHQPISNQDGSIHIVFNGEIYNHADLRRDLEERGYHYQTRSDTETIVHLYEEYEERCVDHLRGMFAFAIWDEQNQLLFCARDRLGIKPLYYCLVGERHLVLASEIKSLLRFPGVRARLEDGTVSEYLAFGYVNGPCTLFADIKSLTPGHTLTAKGSGDIRISRYWDLPASPNRAGSFENYAVNYRELLESAVESHLMSDVPLGVLLSGGLDSSLVAALMQKRRRDSIQTFSVGYAESESSELPMAQQVASVLRTEHHQVKVTADDFFESLPRLIWHEDQPLVWPSSVSLYFVCQLARQHVKVVLTGEGSDETMAGYDRYALTLWNRRLARLYCGTTPGAARVWIARQISERSWLKASLRRRLGHTFLARDNSVESLFWENFYSAFTAADQAEVLAAGIGTNPYDSSRKMWNSSGEFLTDLLHFDIRTYLVELLRKQDRMSMAASIESRVPFLDHVAVEYALGISGSHKMNGLDGKRILKEAARGLLPDSVIFQKKRGFPTPWRRWLLLRSNDVQHLLLEPRTQQRGLFRRDAISRMFAQHRANNVDHSDRIWRLLNLELWHRVFVDADPAYLQSEEVVVGGMQPA